MARNLPRKAREIVRSEYHIVLYKATSDHWVTAWFSNWKKKKEGNNGGKWKRDRREGRKKEMEVS
jgi:hypothetical protein